MDPVTVTIVAAVVASGTMSWSVGAESNSPPFAPAVGANALPVMRAALLVGVFASLGAVVQGASISEAVGEELVLNAPITPLAAAAGIFTAAFLVFLGVRRGYPIPAAFTVTGAMVGVGLSLGGDPAVGKYVQIAALWLVIPFVGGGIAFGTAYLLRRDEVPEALGIPLLAGLVGFVLANVSLSFIPSPDGEGATLAGYASASLGSPFTTGSLDVAALLVSAALGLLLFVAMRRSLQRSLARGVNRFLIALGAVVAFSSGGSQVGLATGPLQNVFETDLHLSTAYLLAFGGVGILVGSWTGAPRLISAVSREYSSLGARRSIAALVPAFLIAQTAILLGVPISFNEIIISSVIGSGLVEGRTGVSRDKILYTVAAWLLAIAAAFAIGYGTYWALHAATGIQ